MWYDITLLESSLCHVTHVITNTNLRLILTLGAKNRENENNWKERIENRKTVRKELSPLLTTLTVKLSKFQVSQSVSGLFCNRKAGIGMAFNFSLCTIFL